MFKVGSSELKWFHPTDVPCRHYSINAHSAHETSVQTTASLRWSMVKDQISDLMRQPGHALPGGILRIYALLSFRELSLHVVLLQGLPLNPPFWWQSSEKCPEISFGGRGCNWRNSWIIHFNNSLNSTMILQKKIRKNMAFVHWSWPHDEID